LLCRQTKQRIQPRSRAPHDRANLNPSCKTASQIAKCWCWHRAPLWGKHGPPTTRPSHYISQDKTDNALPQYLICNRTTMSIFQEAMLACVDITKPTFTLSATKLASHKLPMIWLCKMANSVLGNNGELLEYHHLITNLKTRATWMHSYGNELR
jgi:hypothetical protein